MKAIINGELQEYEQMKLSFDDRGFRYGDGLFETIAVVHNKPRFLDRHYVRITNGAIIFGMKTDGLSLEKLRKFCSTLILTNMLEEDGKIRLSVWRKEGGLYSPNGGEIYYLITAEATDTMKTPELKKVDFSENVTNCLSSLSPFKTMSALKYVIAGLEKKQKGIEEIIINDTSGFVSETLDSNIFMKKNGVYFTPPVATGCIEGIMRGWILEAFKAQQIPFEERFFIPNELLEADAVFTANAMGIRHILQIRPHIFEKDLKIEEVIASIS